MESNVESTPVKKKRGRPKKVQVHAIDNSSILEARNDMHRTPRQTDPLVTDGDVNTDAGNQVPINNTNLIDEVVNDEEERFLGNNQGGASLLNLNADFPGLDRLSLMNNYPNQTRGFMDLSKVLPGFDPVTGRVDIHQWIDKIEEYADMYGWDDLATKHYALSKLEGVAKTWKDSLERSNRTWNDWKILLERTFISEDTGVKKVLEAQNYKRKSGQNIVEYFYEKLSKCNKAKMGTRETIEWIVEGLGSFQYRTYLGPLSRYHQPTDLLVDLQSGDDFIRERTIPKASFMKKDNRREEYKFGHASGRETSNDTPKFKRRSKDEIICFKCGNAGHYARDCSGQPEKKERVKDVRKAERETVLHIEGNSHAKFFKKAMINRKEIRCYIDLGSSVTLLRKDYADNLHLTYFEGKFDRLTGYGGGEVTPIGVMTVELEIDGVLAKCNIFVVPSEAQIVPLLVGHSYTEQQNVHILNSQGTLNIASDVNDLLNIESVRPSKTKFLAEEEIVIPKNYLGHINVIGSILENDFYINGNIQESGNIIPRCVISTNEKGESCIPILNLSNNDITINKGQTIARGEVCMEEEVERETHTDEIREDEIDSDLEANEHSHLIELLNKYRGVVARNTQQIGQTNAAEMSIQLTTENPVCYRPYRLSYHEKEQVKDMIMDLKKADVIEESSSPYASPIILVRKKTGEVRMCVDYRALNKITIKDRYPIPLIDDQIDRLRGHRYFTSLDLFSGYYQVPMAKDSRDKTAFVTPNGQYQFKRMPFGLCNAPAVFQRMINVILGSLDGDTAMAYLDDIISGSRTFEDGMVKLEKILDVLISAGVTINLKKCHFFKSKVDYLGFEISQSGIGPGTKKVNCIKSFPTPTNVKAVRSFVGLASYFRRFVKGFATIIKPMTDLLTKKEIFVWNAAQEKAFEEIKLKLSSRPVLAIYNVNAKTEVHTDASQHGLGAVLFQEQDDKRMHPISFFSRKTTNDEAKYHSYELEALAIVCALEKFRVYLIGLEFTIKTDCNSLKLLENKRDLNPRIGRWFVRLSEFNYHIEYLKGAHNCVADGLSRYPVNPAEETPIVGIPIMGINVNTDWIAAMQRGSPEILIVRDKLEDGDAETHSKFSMCNARVYRVTKGRWRLFVPKELRHEVVAEAHKSLAHLGIDKTLSKLKETYYFPGMREYVTTYVNRCISCLYYKSQTGKKAGYLHPIEKGSIPFETIHVDHLGPFVKTEDDNKYVLGVICAYSKYVMLEAVKSTGSDETVAALQKLMAHYGKPKRIISDQGTAYTSTKFKNFCSEYEIKHVLIAAGTPRANGQIERVNRVILNCLPTITKDVEHSDWDEKIYELQWAINNSTHRITKQTPAELIFNYKPIGTGDSLLTREIQKINDEFGVEIEKEDVSELLEKNKKIISEQFNKKRKYAEKLEPGQLVLVRYEAPATGESRKLTEKYRGPYEVIKEIGNDRYLIQDIEGEKQSQRVYKGIIAIDRLKKIPKGD